MKTTKITKKIMISATAAEVWKTITSKETVKKYFFGTNVESDWKQGSSITYSGTWEGKEYKDKGDILKVKKTSCCNIPIGAASPANLIHRKTIIRLLTN